MDECLRLQIPVLRSNPQSDGCLEEAGLGEEIRFGWGGGVEPHDETGTLIGDAEQRTCSARGQSKMAVYETGSRVSLDIKPAGTLILIRLQNCEGVWEASQQGFWGQQLEQRLFEAWPGGARWGPRWGPHGLLSFKYSTEHHQRQPLHVPAASHSGWALPRPQQRAQRKLSLGALSPVPGSEPGLRQPLTNCATELLVSIRGGEPWKPGVLSHFRRPSASIIQGQGLSS